MAMIHRSLGPAGRATLLAACAALVLVACGDDNPSDPIDVTAACDRLEDLAIAVAEGRNAESLDEFADSTEEPMTDFVEAAEASGDDRLVELATPTKKSSRPTAQATASTHGKPATTPTSPWTGQGRAAQS